MLQKEIESPRKGYKLIDFGSHWEFHSYKGVKKGNFKQICTYAVVEFGFSPNEFEIAVQEMEKYFHNGAEFGMFKRFMWTFDSVGHRLAN